MRRMLLALILLTAGCNAFRPVDPTLAALREACPGNTDEEILATAATVGEGRDDGLTQQEQLELAVTTCAEDADADGTNITDCVVCIARIVEQAYD